MTKRNQKRPSSKLIDPGGPGGIKKKRRRPSVERSTRQDWLKRLRPRDHLVKRGQATALGIHLVKNQLRTLNANLKEQLLTNAPPFGFGTLSGPMDRGSELLDCLFELREMLATLQFHLDLDDMRTLPTYVPVTFNGSGFQSNALKYNHLLSRDDSIVGKIALAGLVNRYSSAIFSDHHGLVLDAQVGEKANLKIYYHSLDATNNFSGSTVVRSNGGMLPFTGSHGHDTSLRGVVGFREQLLKLMVEIQGINVIVLAEIGLNDAVALIQPIVEGRWHAHSTNDNSGSNEITIIHKTEKELTASYSFSVEETDLGNAAKIVAGEGTDKECILLGCHILNNMANNEKVGKFMEERRVAALFGDTNISTKGSSKIFGFDTIESESSITDPLTFKFSNSAANKMFDKLLVRINRPTSRSESESKDEKRSSGCGWRRRRAQNSG